MKAYHRLTLMSEHPMKLSMWSHLEVKLSIHLPRSLQLPHPVLLNLFWTHFVVFMRVLHNGIICSIEVSFGLYLPDLYVAVVNVEHLLLVEVALAPLLNELGGNDVVFDTSLYFLHPEFCI